MTIYVFISYIIMQGRAEGGGGGSGVSSTCPFSKLFKSAPLNIN